MKILLALLFTVTLSVSHGFVIDILRGFTTCSDAKQSKSPVNDIDPTCLDDADSGNCRFYDCFERRYPCDTCGFAKEYGQSVCEKFQQPTIYNRFDDAGKRWVDATNRCLLTTMKELYQRSSVSCDASRSTMIDQVSNCYLRNDAGVSFCDIAVANREALTGVFEAGNFIRSHRVLTVVVQLITSCAGSGTNAVANRVKEFLANTNNVSDLRNRIRERVMNATSGVLGGRISDIISEVGSSGIGIGSRIGDILTDTVNRAEGRRDRVVGQAMPLSPQSNQPAGNEILNNTEIASSPIGDRPNTRTPILGNFFLKFMRNLFG